MNKSMNRQRTLFVLAFLVGLCEQFSFREKTVTLNRYSTCAQAAIQFNGTITNIIRNKYAVDGEFTIKEFIAGPIEVQFT